jgi:hypothetical protein
MIDDVVINARALSIITAMADVARDRLMAAHMIIVVFKSSIPLRILGIT